MKKDILKSLITIRQREIPFDLMEREMTLPTSRKKIITVSGVRRCGKSTMMEIAINSLVQGGVDPKRILWIGFDDERLKDMSSEELDEIVEAYMEMYPDIPIKDVHMFFDEIQLIKYWEYFVLRVYKSYCKKIYVCGSNATLLSTELVSAMRGYPLEFRTYPLSFNEYCRFKGVPVDVLTEQGRARLKTTFMEFNSSSAFPEVVLTSSESERLKILHGYFDAMILKDLAEHYRIGNPAVLRYFVKRIMSNLTKPTSINSLYNDIKSQGFKIAKDELYSWGDYICNIFMFIRISKFDRSIVKERRSPDKYYFIDNGMRSAVLMPYSSDNGKYLENTVLLQLVRMQGPGERISYYQNGGECDFVVQRGEAVAQLMQVTWDMDDPATRDREVKGLLAASAATKCDNLLIITSDEEGEFEVGGKKIRVMPAWKWILQDNSGAY